MNLKKFERIQENPIESEKNQVNHREFIGILNNTHIIRKNTSESEKIRPIPKESEINQRESEKNSREFHGILNDTIRNNSKYLGMYRGESERIQKKLKEPHQIPTALQRI